MDPNATSNSGKKPPANIQNKQDTSPQLERESVDSSERSSIKGIIKTDHSSPDADAAEYSRLKSKMVSFSSYDDYFNRGAVPSKSVQVNLNDDNIPDKTTIERRYSKLEDEKSHTTSDLPEEKKPVAESAETKQTPEDKKTEESAETKQTPEDKKTEDTTPQVEDVPGDNTSKLENKHDNEAAKIAEIIESMRPDQSVPRQYVIIEYIEQYLMDDNEDPTVKEVFEMHHDSPNLASFPGKSNQTKGQWPGNVTESAIKIFDNTNKEKHTNEEQDISEQHKCLECIVPVVEIGFEYHGPCTSAMQTNRIFDFCPCQQNVLNCFQSTTSESTPPLVSNAAINKNTKTKPGLKKVKSNKMLKGHKQAKKLVDSNSNNSKSNKTILHSANRKSGNKK